MLKFLMERRIEAYRPTKEVVHTHNAGAMFQEFLKRMDDQAKLAPPMLTSAPIEPEIIDITPAVAPTLPQGPEGTD